MKGLSFYFYLRTTLTINQVIGTSTNGNEYTFLNWGEEGELKYNSSDTIKSIPCELIISSYYVSSKNIIIDINWLISNGKNDWCTPPVLNNLFENYTNTFKIE